MSSVCEPGSCDIVLLEPPTWVVTLTVTEHPPRALSTSLMCGLIVQFQETRRAFGFRRFAFSKLKYRVVEIIFAAKPRRVLYGICACTVRGVCVRASDLRLYCTLPYSKRGEVASKD